LPGNNLAIPGLVLPVIPGKSSTVVDLQLKLILIGFDTMSPQVSDAHLFAANLHGICCP
jgi:hypothetical protein